MAGKSKRIVTYFEKNQYIVNSTAIIAACGGENLEPDTIPVDRRIALSKASAMTKVKKTGRLKPTLIGSPSPVYVSLRIKRS